MFFLLSKTLDLLLEPWWWAAGGGVLALVLFRLGRRRAGLACAVVGASTLVVFSLPVVAGALWASLERDAVSTVQPGVTYDVVVLLGGMVSPSGSSPESPAFNDNVDRLLTTWELLRTNRARRVLITGGPLRSDLDPEAEILARQLRSWGIESERLIIEPRARNTAENAKLSKPLLEGQGRIVLVTSAFHVPRAVGCFRDAGLEVDVLPVDHRMRTAPQGWAPGAAALSLSTEALRELVGRLVYRLTAP